MALISVLEELMYFAGALLGNGFGYAGSHFSGKRCPKRRLRLTTYYTLT
jgi:hypothetical protein